MKNVPKSRNWSALYAEGLPGAHNASSKTYVILRMSPHSAFAKGAPMEKISLQTTKTQ